MVSVAFKWGKALPVPFLMAVFAGSAVGTAIMFLPIGLIETIVMASGLPALVPAAASPLGMTARSLCAIGGASVAMVLTAGGLMLVDRIARALSPRARPEPIIVEEFAPRRRVLAPVQEDEPRRPIFAETDLGASFDIPEAEPVADDALDAPYELVEPIVEEQPELLDLAPIARAMWQVPPRLPSFVDAIDDGLEGDPADQFEIAEFAPVEEEPVAPEPVEAPRIAPVPAFAAPEALDRDSLSLMELLNRLEAGMERRRRSDAVAPVRDTRPPVTQTISDMDEALRDALGTLRRMSAHSR